MSDKTEPGHITDEQVEAFRRAHAEMVEAGEGSGSAVAIRAGLAAAYVRREVENRTAVTLHPINFDPYPATVDEVADEIARFVLELENGPARGVAGEVRARLDAQTVTRSTNPHFRSSVTPRCESECMCRTGQTSNGWHHERDCPEWVLPL